MRYLLNVTFYAGSDDIEDTDTGLYILEINNLVFKTEMERIFDKVNSLCNISLNEEDAKDINFATYKDGANIDTLMNGVEAYTKGKIIKMESNCGSLCIDNYYDIEQWQ